ncbi:low molecular weight protein-tyrosine-phosphatase [Streptomyces antibioticus]|uniref:low molecular weight protein-tyrosine-phosphatase n=1 Tax=Streptomyces antibioticus TaxID=1890 RepID=UPI0036FA10A8
MTYRVCFVCTGNICRSPMAESVFRARVADAGLDSVVEVDSAGTGGWHEGEDADPRTLSVLGEHGYVLAHAARVFEPSWFARRDLVIALDTGHLKALRRLAPSPRDASKVRLLRSYDPGAGDDLDVPDPYYGGRDGFVECLEMVERAGAGLLGAVREELEGRTT